MPVAATSFVLTFSVDLISEQLRGQSTLLRYQHNCSQILLRDKQGDHNSSQRLSGSLFILNPYQSKTFFTPGFKMLLGRSGSSGQSRHVTVYTCVLCISKVSIWSLEFRFRYRLRHFRKKVKGPCAQLLHQSLSPELFRTDQPRKQKLHLFKIQYTVHVQTVPAVEASRTSH